MRRLCLSLHGIDIRNWQWDGLNTARSHDYGFHRRRDGRPVLRRIPRLRETLPEIVEPEPTMLVDYILGGAVTVFLLVYLTYALVRPERF